MKKQDVIEAHGIASPKRKPTELLSKRLLTVKEAAEYLGRSEWSVRELIWAGSLPIVREGRRIHLDLEDLDNWISERKTRYTS